MNTVVLDHTIRGAAPVLLAGGVAAVPTETVYGLAVDALNEKAVEQLFALKGRSERKPVSIFVTDIAMAERFCLDIPSGAYKLAERFWPGPLTLVLKRRRNVPDAVTAGSGTVGVRCPDDRLTLALLREAGVPLTGTSANISGAPDAICLDDVLSFFDGKIDLVIDGGPSRGGLPSTVLDMTVSPPRLLRRGGVSAEELEAVLGEAVEASL